MKLTRAADYGIRCVLYMAKKPKGSIVLLKNIYEELDTPKHLTSKIMRKLVENGIVKSFIGTGGGYSLSKPASEISMLDVIECIEGEINLNECTTEDGCPREYSCEVYPVWAEIQENLKTVLGNYNFSNLLKKG